MSAPIKSQLVDRVAIMQHASAFTALATSLPPPPIPHGELGENLQRAVRTMRASIEQATGRQDRTLSYRVARGAAVQATTHIECYRCLRVIEHRQYEAAMALLRPLVATLTRLAYAAPIAIAVLLTACVTPQPRRLAPAEVTGWPEVESGVLAGRLVGGARQPAQSNEAKSEMTHAGTSHARVGLKLCMSGQGDATSVDVTESSGFPRIDNETRTQLERWQFKPGSPACTRLVIAYSVCQGPSCRD